MPRVGTVAKPTPRVRGDDLKSVRSIRRSSRGRASWLGIGALPLVDPRKGLDCQRVSLGHPSTYTSHRIGPDGRVNRVNRGRSPDVVDLASLDFVPPHHPPFKRASTASATSTTTRTEGRTTSAPLHAHKSPSAARSESPIAHSGTFDPTPTPFLPPSASPSNPDPTREPAWPLQCHPPRPSSTTGSTSTRRPIPSVPAPPPTPGQALLSSRRLHRADLSSTTASRSQRRSRQTRSISTMHRRPLPRRRSSSRQPRPPPRPSSRPPAPSTRSWPSPPRPTPPRSASTRPSSRPR